MKDERSQYLNRPFRDLANLLAQHKIAPKTGKRARPEPDPRAPHMSPRQEADLFLEAMADVTPINVDHARRKILPHALLRQQNRTVGERDTLKALRDLIRYGEGFIVSQTPEYMEFANPGASDEVLRRLHNGHYAIQDHIDLHGFSRSEAAPALERFIRHSIQRSLRAVLVVHGRGLTSPGRPVLKRKVLEWLTRGPLRKWVIALTSAQSCDGGTGATYVLLRSRPMTKSQRKKLRPSN